MKINKTLVVFLLIPLLVGIISYLLSMNGISTFASLKKPLLAPPSFLFPVVWTLLYILMGYSSYLIYESNTYHTSCCLMIYLVNLFLNFLWTPIFFDFKLHLFALIILILLDFVIVYMIFCFMGVNKKAAYFQIPYLVWCLFATYLNFSIYLLNR